MTELSFSEKYNLRTKQFAVQSILFYVNYCKKSEELKIIGKQYLRSSTSVAANFRAFTRGRSEAEKFSKLCIVLEEIDESVFWLELVEETHLIPTDNFLNLKNEAIEILKIISTTRKNMKKQPIT
jgi:four helix bundle protein